ncbi:MAG: PadR family transcriptional regulator [Candidatus Aquicultorales bacterium]
MSVKHGILAILARRPLHGYELRQELESELGAGWSINFGQVYTTLERLERDYLVLRSESGGSTSRERILYSITPAGQDELNGWFLKPIPSGENPRDELYAKVMLSFSSAVSTEDVIHAQRKEELRKMHDLTRVKRKADPIFEMPRILQLDQAIIQAEGTLRWLNMCEARLERLNERLSGDLAVRVKQSGKTPESRGTGEDTTVKAIDGKRGHEST